MCVFVVTVAAHEPCNCSSYLPLLYVISGAACLLGVLVLTLTTAYCVSILIIVSYLIFRGE